MQNSQISFKSRINFIDSVGYVKTLYKNGAIESVNAPWTANEIVRAQRAYTDGIQTCTAGGILVKNPQEGHDIVMFHINPIEEENYNLTKVKQTILDKIGNDNPIKAFLLGRKESGWDYIDDFKLSIDNFKKLEYFIKSLKIPFTKFEGIPFGGHHCNMMYDGKIDEFKIFHSAIPKPKEDILHQVYDNFERIELAPNDEIVFSNTKGVL